jgi:high-affinity Fe2+/Pb2+ permease
MSVLSIIITMIAAGLFGLGLFDFSKQLWKTPDKARSSSRTLT